MIATATGLKMLLFWCETDYLLIMAAWSVGLILALRWLLLQRRHLKRKPVLAGSEAAGGPEAAGGVIRADTSAPAGRAVRPPVTRPPVTRTAAVERRSWPLKLAFSVWALLAVLTALELGFAAFVDTTDAFSATNVSDRWFRRHVDPCRNDAGFRDRRDLPQKKTAGIRRLFFFGDSFTIAQGVDRLEDRFTDRVEAELNRRRRPDGPQFEVANLGEFGWDVSLIEGMVQATLEKGYQPDMVIYVYMLNDIEGYDPRTEVAIRGIQRTQPRFWLWSRTYFFNWLYFCWQQFRAGRTVDYFPHLADSYDSPVWLNVRAALQRMKDRCDARGVEFRMVIFPFLHNLGPEYPFAQAHRKLAEFCTQSGVKFLDLEPVLTPHAGEGLMVNRFDNHPNERCHAIVADAIVEQLLADQIDAGATVRNP